MTSKCPHCGKEILIITKEEYKPSECELKIKKATKSLRREIERLRRQRRESKK